MSDMSMYKPVNMDEIIADTIAQFEGAKVLEGQAFPTLRAQADGCASSVEFFDRLKGGERQRVADKFGSLSYIFKGDGTIKWNGFSMPISEAEDMGLDFTVRRDKAFIHTLPAAYKTAKSVLGRAIDMGMSVDGRGKTELEKAIRARSIGKNDFEKAVEYARRLRKLKDTLSSSEWYDVEVIING